MAKPKVLPAIEQDDTVQVELADGSRLRMYPMTWQLMKAVSAADPETPESSTRDLMQAVEDAVVDAQFKNGRSLQLQPVAVFREIFKAWTGKEDEVALPPANGQPSATPS